MTISEVENYMALCRKYGASSLKIGDFSVTFPGVAMSQASDELEGTQEKAPIKRGSDGLTAEEQFALYGRVVDAEG